MQNEEDSPASSKALNATFIPLGDKALLVRFGECISARTNESALKAAQRIANAKIPGVGEVNPTLVSVQIQYMPEQIGFFELSQQVRLLLAFNDDAEQIGLTGVKQFEIGVTYGSDAGPDLVGVAEHCNMSVGEFVTAHNSAKLRVLATGFAPGFVYCGLHVPGLHIPRRTKLHKRVAPGSIIFAAGQTAITASYMPTGWHVIGCTNFLNFDANLTPPAKLRPGDQVSFFSESSS